MADSLPSIDFNEFRKVVETRRSVRKFTAETVPDSVVDECLDLALLSPNSSNLQPWEFWVIRDQKLREQLVPALMNQNAARTAQALVCVLGRRDTWREHAAALLRDYPGGNPPDIVRKYYTSHSQFIYEQGRWGWRGPFKRLILWWRGRKAALVRDPVTVPAQREWVTKTCALAAQTFMLAMRARGYDTCPMEGFDRHRVAKILPLPDDAWIVMFIACGKRAEKGVYGARYRVPRTDVVKYL